MQNDFYANQNNQVPNVVLAHALRGEPVAGAYGTTHGGDVQQASRYSTAPYKPPKRRKSDTSLDKPLCVEEGCKAFPLKDTEFCSAHARQKGLIEHPQKGKEWTPERRAKYEATVARKKAERERKEKARERSRKSSAAARERAKVEALAVTDVDAG